MKNLKTVNALPYLSIFDAKGQQCVFLGGVYTPVDEEQFTELLKSYKGIIEEATEADGAPATIQDLKDYQATQTLIQQDVSANISESVAGKLNPANSTTINAVVAGITPTRPLVVPTTTKK